jgi:hypothetical protein
MTDPRESAGRLLGLNGPVQGKAFPLSGVPTVLGRTADCQISLDLVSISRRHAEFRCQGDVCRVKDLGSRNGVKVNGNLVREADLRPGDVVSVGEVDFQYDAAAPTPAMVPRPLSARDLAVQTRGTEVTGSPQAPAEKREHIGLNLKFIAVIALVFILSIVAGFLLLRLRSMRTRVREGRFPPVLVRVGEQKWVRIQGIQRINSGGKEVLAKLGDFSSSITVSEPQVAAAAKYDPGELLITGLVGGETDVQIKMDSGNLIRILVLVRGRREDPLEALEYGAYSQAERNAMAEQFVANGLLVEKSKPYVALQEYEKAIAVLQPVPKGQVYIQAKDRRKQAEDAVNERWTGLKQEITLALGNHDYAQAAQLLQEALQLVPDPNDPRRQKSEWYLRYVLQSSMAQKTRGGRS